VVILVQIESSYAENEEVWTMPKKSFTAGEIIHKLREAEVLAAQGRTVGRLGVTHVREPRQFPQVV
jgi:hypothetical protein